MKNIRILIAISTFLATSSLMHLQGMELETDADDTNKQSSSTISDNSDKTDDATSSDSLVVIRSDQQTTKAQPAAPSNQKKQKNVGKKTTADNVIGHKRQSSSAVNNPAKKSKTDPYFLVSTYNEKTAEYTQALLELQTNHESINLSEFQENISTLKRQTDDLITRKKSISRNAPISQNEYSNDSKQFASIINFLNSHKATPRLSSLQPMVFSNWWTSITSLIEEDEKLKKATSKAIRANNSANRYFYASLALGGIVVCTAARGYFFGS